MAWSLFTPPSLVSVGPQYFHLKHPYMGDKKQKERPGLLLHFIPVQHVWESSFLY